MIAGFGLSVNEPPDRCGASEHLGHIRERTRNVSRKGNVSYLMTEFSSRGAYVEKNMYLVVFVSVH